MAGKKKVEGVDKLTPIAPAKFVALKEPDPKWGKYQVALVLDPENDEHAKFIDEIEQLEQEMIAQILKGVSKAKQARLQHFPLITPEIIDDEETGYLQFRAKSQYVPAVFDALNRQLVDVPYVPNGSKLRLYVKLTPYLSGLNYGVSSYLRAVQIVELAERKSDLTNVFEPIDSGFTADVVTQEDDDTVPF